MFIETIKKSLNKIPFLKKFESFKNIFSPVERIKEKKYISSNFTTKKFKEDEILIVNKLKKKISKKNQAKKIYIKQYNYQLGNDDSNEDVKNKNDDNNNSFHELRSKNINLPLINNYEEEEEDEDEGFEDNNKKVKNNKNQKKKKIDFISLDELFELSNYEGKNEAIIDEELHSNDEGIFERKIIPSKNIINDYIKNIKKEVPSLNFSQIEFNKAKVINEADLYSFQRRNFEANNINERIYNIKKKIKKIKNKINLNEKKYKAIRNFIQETKNNYNKILRPIKIKSTVETGNINFKIQNLLSKLDTKKEVHTKKNAIEEELVGSDYSDEDKYEEKDLKPPEIDILPDDEDNGNEFKNNNIYIKTQCDINKKNYLNLFNNNIYDNNKKQFKSQIKESVEDNSKFNSK